MNDLMYNRFWDFRIEIDESTPGIMYIWYTTPNTDTSESKWKILKIDETVSWYTKAKFPKKDWESNAGFYFVWDDRASYTY